MIIKKWLCGKGKNDTSTQIYTKMQLILRYVRNNSWKPKMAVIGHDKEIIHNEVDTFSYKIWKICFPLLTAKKIRTIWVSLVYLTKCRKVSFLDKYTLQVKLRKEKSKRFLVKRTRTSSSENALRQPFQQSSYFHTLDMLCKLFKTFCTWPNVPRFVGCLNQDRQEGFTVVYRVDI